MSKKLILYEIMRKSFDKFFRGTAPAINYLYGEHTKVIIQKCQEAVDAIRARKTKYLIITVPPRHGKTDIVSRRLPAWFLGTNPDLETILACYNSDLAEEYSEDARNCYLECLKAGIFKIPLVRNTNQKWKLKRRKGIVRAVGLQGGITGKGAHLFIIDDYLRNRADAEQKGVRNKLWEGFKANVITRLSPEGHALIILATPWHVDDLIGRIKKESEKDPDFPKFEHLKFPAQDKNGKWLFLKRFSEKIYKSFKSAVGKYNWQSLYLCDPKLREGNLLKASNAKKIKPEEVPEGLKWFRFWDLASSQEERTGDDPDYTASIQGAYDNKTKLVYFRQLKRFKEEAPKRDKNIEETGYSDVLSGCVDCEIESVAGYKDTYTRMKVILKGVQKVHKITVTKDKVAKASVLEAKFEAGLVRIVDDGSDWDSWTSELEEFPSGEHDDMVDATVGSVYKRLLGSLENEIKKISVGGL